MNSPADNAPKIKTCPRCNSTFECLHAEGCWCFDYTVSPENLEKIRGLFSDCLCPSCLPIFAEKKATPDESPEPLVT